VPDNPGLKGDSQSVAWLPWPGIRAAFWRSRDAIRGNVKAALSIARNAINDAPIGPIKTNFNTVGNPLVTQGTADMLRNADGQAPAYSLRPRYAH